MGQCCDAKQIVNFFKAMCDHNRHKILHLIKKNKEMNATDIIAKMDLSQPTVSHHLKIMVDAEVLVSRKEGKETYYKLNEKHIHHCCHGFAKDIRSKESQK